MGPAEQVSKAWNGRREKRKGWARGTAAPAAGHNPLHIVICCFSNLEFFRLSRQHGAVPQGHLANSRPYHQAGMSSEATETTGQVSAGQSLQPGLKGFELSTKQNPSGKVMTTHIMPNRQIYCTPVGHIPSSLETRQYHVIYMKEAREQKA